MSDKEQSTPSESREGWGSRNFGRVKLAQHALGKLGNVPSVPAFRPRISSRAAKPITYLCDSLTTQ